MGVVKKPQSEVQLPVHTVSGELATVVGCSDVDSVRDIKEKIRATAGGRVKMMRLLHKDTILDDDATIPHSTDGENASLTLVHMSAARLSFLPHFNGVYQSHAGKLYRGKGQDRADSLRPLTFS